MKHGDGKAVITELWHCMKVEQRSKQWRKHRKCLQIVKSINIEKILL